MNKFQFSQERNFLDETGNENLVILTKNLIFSTEIQFYEACSFLTEIEHFFSENSQFMVKNLTQNQTEHWIFFHVVISG